MREKMKKMLFLMLFLLILGAANVSAQVRIGGNGQPNTAAVLDLNATDAINTGTKGLALPRVSLTNVNTALTGSPTINGMIVYNTNASVTGGSGVGIYYWVTSKWVKMLNSDFVEADGVVGNEITDTIANGGLTRSGAGTATSPYKVGIKAGGIRDGMIAVGDLNVNKLKTTPADSGLPLVSNGETATFRDPLGPILVDTNTLNNIPRGSITWTLVVDTTIPLSVPPHAVVEIGMNFNSQFDFCYHARGINRAIMTKGPSSVFVKNPTYATLTTKNFRIRCLRASI
ncbi:hypothetical protein FACS189451_05790 [Bacteroidia bacterium]|nr:hypothetical protein FACS189446_6480 [Bacteroidia bacterium]GHT62147.1 hypothetical protein FACS189451_05790 [Bacteroidia bacterium]